ncbi:hypothetical protein BSKO_08729 [Bryopsis sp. KO-2023]|nr:hypothetical protein BSKO_08729 [Bryopsis sp. KO-2023]
MGLASDSLLLNLALSAGLVVLSGLFSGLTLGLMSLDKVGLQILAEAGDPKERKFAAQIAPIREHGNLLLCTLLIGNTVVNALLAIFMADITGGLGGLLVSTSLIVIFGEIAPQAVCSRHGLFVGAKTIWLTRAVICVLFIVAYPISVVLDKALGKEIGTVYSREELKRLITIHVENPEAQLESGLTQDDSHILTGALEYKDKCVKEVMTTIDKTFMLEMSVKLDFETMLDVYKSGYTRIPVYEIDRGNIVGVLYTKDLVLLDADDEIEVRAVLAFHGLNHAKFISDMTKLHDVLNIFKTSYTHLMVARDDKSNEVTGVITLEDVIEEVMKTEIIDETDNYVNNDHRQRTKRDHKNRPAVTEFLKLFGHKLRHHGKLSSEEILATVTFLKAAMDEFKIFNDNLIRGVVRKAEVVEVDEVGVSLDLGTLPSIEGATWVDGCLVLYKKGQRSEFFTLILQGHTIVKAGNDEFMSEQGPWSCIAAKALSEEDYYPDFTATCSAPCRILRIRGSDYRKAKDWSQRAASV